MLSNLCCLVTHLFSLCTNSTMTVCPDRDAGLRMLARVCNVLLFVKAAIRGADVHLEQTFF